MACLSTYAQNAQTHSKKVCFFILKIKYTRRYFIVVSSIFDTIGEALTSFMEVLTSGFNGIVSLIWTTTENGGELTPLGIILLVGLGVGVAYFVLSFIIRAIRNVGKSN